MTVRQVIKSTLLGLNASLLRDDGPKIVFYHDVTGRSVSRMSTPFEKFVQHVESSKLNGWKFVRGIPVGRKQLLICFDDGYRGIWDRRDFFLKEGIFPIVSIAIELVGQPEFLTWEEILELRKMGFKFISHTWSHRSLTEVSEAELSRELAESRQRLSEKLGEDVDWICFPRGLFSGKVVEQSLAAGYSTGLASIPGLASESLSECDDRMRIVPRMLVQDLDRKQFEFVLRGGMLPLRHHYVKRQFKGV